ncbi:Cellulose biosynthesis protein BcsQ [Cryobacterium flavum]|uniref:Cellulose biosynthesis protein BcsQ n=1 Tax=Cryobacterium flavum TaxID=1424659 RepID=A0A4R8UY01_9MICO|nr:MULTISPECIES: ParA family protein [Cryobacterium]TFB72899.1 ParA family protein [Cryobacterium flavum]SDO44539.1 Cellulose biosynthesis protein BcsQ [Cryobacterium flavum]
MKTVAVYSTKGGVGKTTAAVNLAWEASRECRVLLWDLDPQGASTYVLNVKPRVKGGVNSLIRGKTEMDAAIRSTVYENLAVLPADETYRDLDLVLDAAKKSTHRIAKALESVAREYDVVILDCPPGESRVAENALHAADLVVLPLVPSPLSLRSLAQVNEIIADSDSPPKVFAFLSMVDRRKLSHRAAAETLPREYPQVIDLVVPATVVIERMGSERAPVGSYAPDTEAARVFAELWEYVRTSSKVKRAAPSKLRAR